MPKARRISDICSALTAPVAVAILVHAGLDVILVVYPWELREWVLLGALAVPVSQNGLIALWAGTHSAPSYVRCVGLSLGLAATWYVAMMLLPIFELREVAAAWVVAFAVQALVVILLSVLLRRSPRLGLRAGDATGTTAGSRFSLATLMWWMAALTVPLVLLRLAVVQLGWRSYVLEWELFPHLGVIGAFNGLFAVVVLISLKLRGYAWLKMACGCLVVLGLGAAEVYLLEMAFGNLSGIGLISAVQFAGAQFLVLYVTLRPIQSAADSSRRRVRASRLPSAAPQPASIDEVRITFSK